MVNAALSTWATACTVLVGQVIIGILLGLKWPVVESYICAGRDPKATARAVGLFNVAWATAIPLTLLTAGPIIAGPWPQGLFAIAVPFNAVTLVLLRRLPARPVHLPEEQPHHVEPEELARYKGLMIASRLGLLCSYTLMWILAALLPRIFDELGIKVSTATGLAGLIDLFRLSAFILLQVYVGWVGRRALLVLSLLAMPVGFCFLLSGTSLSVVLFGELCFGLGAGMVYYAALYYAMVVKRASVHAGGGHEGLIGSGFVIGPLIGLAATALIDPLGGRFVAYLAVVGPVTLIFTCSAIVAIVRGKCWRRGGGDPVSPGRP